MVWRNPQTEVVELSSSTLPPAAERSEAKHRGRLSPIITGVNLNLTDISLRGGAMAEVTAL